MRGIYEIRNTITGRVYIGKSKHIQGRWNQHRDALNRGVHINDPLQGDWEALGERAFAFTILEEVNDYDERCSAEARHWAAANDPYNIIPVREAHLDAAPAQAGPDMDDNSNLLLEVLERLGNFRAQVEMKQWTEAGYDELVFRLKDQDERITHVEYHLHGKAELTIGALLFDWLRERKRDVTVLDEIHARIVERLERITGEVENATPGARRVIHCPNCKMSYRLPVGAIPS
jgi:hypothetical protein